MKKINKTLIVFSVVLLFLNGCKKEDPIPSSTPTGPVSIIPQISIKNVSSAVVVQFKDSIVFTVSYIDGNGDIGYENADSTSLFLTDNRGPFTEKYHIPPLAPNGAFVAIQGDLNIKLDRTMLLDTAAVSETTTYSIQLKDRAGNWSNTVTTGTITVVR